MKTNYTPCPDEMTKKHGLQTAGLFGRIWRFSQGEHGYCWASQSTLAEELGVTDRTIRNHLPILIENGYIVEHTGLRGRGYKPAENWEFTSSFDSEKDSARKEPLQKAEKISSQKRKEIPTKKEVKKEEDIMQTFGRDEKEYWKLLMQGYDLQDYPVDVQEVLFEFAVLWKIKPSGRTKKDWIKSGRDLVDACGEFGLEPIKAVYKDFMAQIKPDGTTGYTVTRPGSITKMVIGKAGEMRRGESTEKEQLEAAGYELD